MVSKMKKNKIAQWTKNIQISNIKIKTRNRILIGRRKTWKTLLSVSRLIESSPKVPSTTTILVNACWHDLIPSSKPKKYSMVQKLSSLSFIMSYLTCYDCINGLNWQVEVLFKICPYSMYLLIPMTKTTFLVEDNLLERLGRTSVNDEICCKRKVC